MSPGDAPRVALVHGHLAGDGADGVADGVADYTRRLAAALRDTGADAVAVPVGPGPRDVAAAARRLRGLRPDVVHAQFAPSAHGFAPWTGLLLPDLARAAAPWVTTLHEFGRWSTPSWVPARVWSGVERVAPLDRETGRMIARSRAVLVTNDVHASALADRLGVVAGRAPLVPNVEPVGEPPDRAATRRALGVPVDATLLTFFGFLHPVKGLRHLVDALALLRPHRPDLHLLLLGGHASRALPADEAAAFVDELRARAADGGVADAVTVTGHRPAAEVSAALHASDVGVFPETGGTSTKSGALLAAFAHGLPCVVTASPDGLLVDGGTVVVADRARDADCLAGAIARVLDGAALREAVAAGAAAQAARRRWPLLAADHRALYARVVRG